MRKATANKTSAAVVTRVNARCSELAQMILTRVHGISDPVAVPEPSYVDGLRQAVFTALDYGITTIKHSAGQQAPSVPPTLLVQARLAARNSISLDVVLRRYCGGSTLFVDALIEEAENADLPRSELKLLLRAQASGLDHLLAAISQEYARESIRRAAKTRGQRRTDLIERLLGGHLIDTSELSYNFDSWHLGVLAVGSGAAGILRKLADKLNKSLLFIEQDESVWAWLGDHRPYARLDWQQLLTSSRLPKQIAIGIGEPAQGLLGWRLTHRQAAAALPLALRGKSRVVRYAHVPLLASALQDDLLQNSLRQLYLAPLEAGRDGGVSAKATLRAYFAAAGNVSATAAALGVSRGTVRGRLAVIEDRFGHSLATSTAAVETALRLDDFEEG